MVQFTLTWTYKSWELPPSINTLTSNLGSSSLTPFEGKLRLHTYRHAYQYTCGVASIPTLTLESQEPLARMFSLQERHVTDESWE
jgi:hypothetical protein